VEKTEKLQRRSSVGRALAILKRTGLKRTLTSREGKEARGKGRLWRR
jgi:hypothetical protein